MVPEQQRRMKRRGSTSFEDSVLLKGDEWVGRARLAGGAALVALLSVPLVALTLLADTPVFYSFNGDRPLQDSVFCGADEKASLRAEGAAAAIASLPPLPSPDKAAEADVTTSASTDDAQNASTRSFQDADPAHPWAVEIYAAWSKMYGLNNSMPPEYVGKPPMRKPDGPLVPQLSPYLEECSALTKMREQSEKIEKIGPGLKMPSWVCYNAKLNTSCRRPRTPWVRGNERDNIPYTHIVQRDIWLHQFGKGNCSDPNTRFLLGHWSPRWHGLGASLHLMSVFFSLAIASNRILVYKPPFPRASHKGCKDIGKDSSLDCYVFPITSEACTAKALEIFETQPYWNGENGTIQEAAANRSIVVVSTTTKLWGKYFYKSILEASGANRWGKPWREMPVPFEELSKPLAKPYSDKDLRANWFRAQVTRYMLRWPSAYLCHMTNQERHAVYGLRVAAEVAKDQVAQRALESLEEFSNEEKELLRSNANNNSMHDFALERTLWRFPEEPFIFHPIINMHVRQGDKGKEMKLNTFTAYMWLAHRIRQHNPGVRYIWLSTEMQDVVDSTANYTDWTFLYSDVPRQVGDTRMMVYETKTGVEKLVGVSFANLMIAAQCDFFIGPLMSNWNRLINELRMTNGRLHSSYMAMNHAEW